MMAVGGGGLCQRAELLLAAGREVALSPVCRPSCWRCGLNNGVSSAQRQLLRQV